MPLINIFKKEKKTEKPKKSKEVTVKKPQKVAIQKKPKKEKPSKAIKAEMPISKSKIKISGESWRTLKGPHITEKGTYLNKGDQYVFKVFPEANKTEIKKSIEGLYNVDVLKVRIINIHEKSRRLGKTEGKRKGYKKAIIKIKKGQKIELLPR